MAGTTPISMIIFGIIIISIVTISIGMNQDMTGSGVRIGCSVLACSLILLAIYLLWTVGPNITANMLSSKSIDNVNNNTNNLDGTVKFIIFIIIIFNIGLLLWFISIINMTQNPSEQVAIKNVEVINYMKLYLQMFLFTVTAIIFINLYIVQGIKSDKDAIFSNTSINIFFVIAESIILLMYIIIINTIINKYVTNG
jgi:hypothetical protein